MKCKSFKSILFIAFIAVVMMNLGSCATMFNNKQNTVVASSGKATEVTIMENGSVIFQGPLPTTINVNGSNSYTVQYKDKDGNSRTLQLQKKMSGWFIADILLLGGWIIDLITGDVMEYGKETILPIAYSKSSKLTLMNSISDDLKKDMIVVGNIYKK
jgi:hypothetical protein